MTIKTWQERCEEHPDHSGIVTEAMIRERMMEKIEELRAALAAEKEKEKEKEKDYQIDELYEAIRWWKEQKAKGQEPPR